MGTQCSLCASGEAAGAANAMTVGAPGWAEHACFVSLLLVGHQEQIKSMEYYPVESSLMCSAISSFNLPSVIRFVLWICY
ncbi:hypothetical protein SETIT_5G076500v2 [Setaria italica]|uniref:Uncharacterized protein n=1 Tax=Setaria italica TaxID=4555 RepID=A0A368R2L6_SETIT|nr:hypothetical protein SETIT_5G076500v2 [Setaria italica]